MISWLRFLRERGVEVGVAGSDVEKSPSLKEAASYVVHLNWGRPRSMRTELAALIDLQYVYHRWDPDVVHTHDLSSRLRGHLLGRRLEVPLLLHTRSDEPNLLERLTTRLSHHELASTGEHSPWKTVIPTGLPDSLIHQKMLSVYQNLWLQKGASLERAATRGAAGLR